MTFDTYAGVLVDLDARDAARAVHMLVRQSRFWPTLEEIFAECRALGGAASPSFGEARVLVTAYVFVREGEERDELPPLAAKVLKLLGGIYSLRQTERPSVWWSQYRETYDDLLHAEEREWILAMVDRRLPELEATTA